MKTTAAALIALLALLSTASADTHFVSTNSTPAAPYTNLAEAASSIADALAVCGPADRILVAPGYYRLTNQVALRHGVTIESMDGAQNTIVDGGGTTRCFFLSGASAVVDGFTITNGIAEDGGGVWCESNAVVRNCIMTGNLSTNDS
jgi:hypothetical protein